MEKEQLRTLRELVSASYNRRKEREAIAREQIWEGYAVQERALTNVVKYEFRQIVESLGPFRAEWAAKNYPELPGATVHSFDVRYDPTAQVFDINIHNIRLPDGTLIGDADKTECPHVYLDVFELECNPIVKSFMKDCNVRTIMGPPSYCRHK